MKSQSARLLSIVATLSTMAGLAFADGPQIGQPAPDFTLKDTNGTEQRLSSFKGKHVVLEWTNFGCPFVKKFYNEGDMQKLQKEWTGKDVVWLSICSSGPGKQGNMDAVAAKQEVQEKGLASIYLSDEDGTVGRLYQAKTTPHMFVVGPDGNLIYKGAIDSIRSANSKDIANADNYVVDCLTASLAGKTPSVTDTRSYGCGIKYSK